VVTNLARIYNCVLLVIRWVDGGVLIVVVDAVDIVVVDMVVDAVVVVVADVFVVVFIGVAFIIIVVVHDAGFQCIPAKPSTFCAPADGDATAVTIPDRCQADIGFKHAEYRFQRLRNASISKS
jgi:hypothetical protein